MTDNCHCFEKGSAAKAGVVVDAGRDALRVVFSSACREFGNEAPDR